jgi:hypothetical protein
VFAPEASSPAGRVVPAAHAVHVFEETYWFTAHKFVAIQMLPLVTPAASLVPSLDEVMENQFLLTPTEVSAVHVAPESVEVQIFSNPTTAASLVPSLDEVMEVHLFALPTEVSTVHVRASTGAHANNTKHIVNRQRNVRDPRRQCATTFIFGAGGVN